MSTEEGSHRKRNNYKLLVDPELQKGKKKLYRLNGAIPGKPPIADPEDPRVQKTVLGVIGSDLELPVPRFKCDRFWVNADPQRDVLITGVTEQIQPKLKEAVERVGAVYSLKFHKSPKLKTLPTSVAFCNAGDGQKAVDSLNNEVVGGVKISVVLDDKGENLKSLLDPLTRRASTDKSLTPTSRNPPSDIGEKLNGNDSRHKKTSSSTPHTPTSASSSSFISTTAHVYPFSGLTLPGGSSPSVGESPSSGCFSPGFTPCTPSSLDSGICLKPFDPLLSLRSSLGKLGGTKTSSTNPPAPPLPPDEGKQPLPPPPPSKEEEGIENISSDEGDLILSPPMANYNSNKDAVSSQLLPSDPRLNKSMWKPIGEVELICNSNKYDMEFEEISGDESPIMVYSTKLEVEEISSDEEKEDKASSDVDMEISDEDLTQDENLIELNVKPISKSFHPFPSPPMMLPPLPPIPMYPPPLPPPGFFPKPPFPPPDIFPPLPPQPPILPPAINGFPENSFKSFPISEKNHFTPSKQWRVPSAGSKRERQGQNVLYRVLEQLASILLRDYEKKVVESAAYPVLDRFWEKREKDRTEKDRENQESSNFNGTVSEVAVKNDTDTSELPSEPYRRMLPGLIPQRDNTEDTPTTPRKRLLNFKIPFVRQRRDAVMISRRRIHEDTRERDRRRKRRHAEDSPPLSKKSRSPKYDLSDISSDELSSEEEQEAEDEEEKEDEIEQLSPCGPRTPPPPLESTEEDEEEESAHESDIFGSRTDDTSSDFEEELRKKRSRNKRQSRRLSSRSDTLDNESLLQPTPTLATPTLATPSPPPVKEEPKKEEVKKVPVYSKRTSNDEEGIVERFLKAGMDKEDLLMIRLAFLRLKSNNSEIISGVPWAYYPPAVSSEPPLKRRRTYQEELHPSGCARSEGYYKIDPRDKTKYLPHLRRGKGEQMGGAMEKSSGSGRGNRLNHRRVASLFTSGDVSREIQQYHQLKARNKQLRFAKSTIHNWGLFALEDIPADEMVVEYVGQYVRQMVADERERRYEAQGIGSSYLFRVDYEYIIDATKSGNFARFINHCCDPNCYAKVIAIGTQKKIVIYSKRDIRCGEEITYDYKFPIEDEKIPCLCGAPHCRGTLN